LYWRRRGNIT